jgi:hypothetical protein
LTYRGWLQRGAAICDAEGAVTRRDRRDGPDVVVADIEPVVVRWSMTDDR